MSAQRRRALGFAACGITDPGPPPHADHLDRWLARGYAGTMRYLHRQARKRKDPRRNVPEALSVVVVLHNYYGEDLPGESRPPKVARYARGADYHRGDAGPARDRWPSSSAARGRRWRAPYADAGPVPERELAQRAGLGWIGKNTMLIRPGAGLVLLHRHRLHRSPARADAPFDHRSLRQLYPLSRRLPHRRLRRAQGAGRHPLHFLPDDRAQGSDPGRSWRRGWRAGSSAATSATRSVPGISGSPCRRGTEPLFRSRGALAGADPELFERMDEAEFDRRFGDTPLARPGLPGMRRNLRAGLTSVRAGRLA